MTPAPPAARPAPRADAAADARGGASSVSTADSGSRNCRFRCTGPGPGCGTGSPSASRPSAASTASRARAAAASASPGAPSGAATSRSSRTAPAKMPGCMVVWFERMPRSSAGRSAEQMMSGTPEWCASSTAGCRFATAVPDVVTTTAGRPDSIAVPSARNAAPRSSMRTCRRIAPTPLELGGGEREGLRSRPGRHDDVADALAHERAQQRHRGIARGAPTGGRPTGRRISHSVGRRDLPHRARRAHRGACARCRACRRCRTRRRMPRRPRRSRSRRRRRCPRSGRRRCPGSSVAGLVGVELGELLLHAADALVLLGIAAQLAEELRVVVGGTVPPRDEPTRPARPRPTMNHSSPPMMGTKRMMTIHQPRRRPRMRIRSKNAQSATA